MEVDSETPVQTDIKKTPEKTVTEEITETKSPVKEDAPKKVSEADHKKNNGTLAGVAAAGAANAASIAANKEKPPMSGVIVQFPEMFSMKRDGHILNKFDKAADIRMQKFAFVECESEEVAVALQAKLNNSNINEKKVTAARLDTTEKNVLYVGALKKETTDDMLKTLLTGIEEVRREKYNTFILFTTEAECRAARAKVTKEGIYGQTLHCDFDVRKDRFKPAEEPAPKKAKEDGTTKSKEEGEESTKEQKEGEDTQKEGEETLKEGEDTQKEEDTKKKEEVVEGEEQQQDGEEEEAKAQDEEPAVKADEW